MKINYNFFTLLVVSTLTFSCSKSFLDVNHNPNAVNDVSQKTLLPNTTVSMAFTNSNELGKAAGLLMQYNAGIMGVASYMDIWNLGNLDNQWSNEIYTNTINNLGILIRKTQVKSPAYAGIAKLELAYTMSLATDLWGDIPYSQAGQGLDGNGFPLYAQPRFDSQMDIYLGNTSKGIKSLFTLVREGLTDIGTYPSRPGIDPGADDIVYGGNLSKWTRFGNSLLIKFALQVSNKAPDTTKAVINDVINNGKIFIDAIDGSLDFNVPFTVANPNAYYLQDIGGAISNSQMLSSRFLAFEKALNDTVRLSKFYTKPGGVFVGFENGSPFAAPAPALRSMYGTYVLGPTRSGEAPVRLITAFRNYFILAEAALRFGVTGDANTYYRNGITASMKSVGMTDAQINTYFTDNPTIVNLSGTPDQMLSQIITQKYIASVGNAIESYNDYRRTGYPLLARPVTTGGDDPNNFPQRFPYTSQEASAKIK